MASSKEMVAELNKLRHIAPYPIDSSFIAGCLAMIVPPDRAPQVRDLVAQLISMAQDKLISFHNILELMTMLKYDLLKVKSQGKNMSLGDMIGPYVTELALNNSYLSYRYFPLEIRPEEIVPENLGVECTICLVDILSTDLCCLGCGHMFHKICISQYSKEKIISKLIPFNCPEEDCRYEITSAQINEYLPRQLRQKYTDFTFHNYVDNHMADTSWCPTPGCSAVFMFDAALTDYRCSVCSKHYCLTCKCEFHTGMSCAEYKDIAELNEEDRKFMMLAKGAKFKQCPSCKFWVEKNTGCDHMTCRCKYQFCYICGGKYNRCKCKGFENEPEEAIIGGPPPLRAQLPRRSISPVVRSRNLIELMGLAGSDSDSDNEIIINDLAYEERRERRLSPAEQRNIQTIVRANPKRIQIQQQEGFKKIELPKPKNLFLSPRKNQASEKGQKRSNQAKQLEFHLQGQQKREIQPKERIPIFTQPLNNRGKPYFQRQRLISELQQKRRQRTQMIRAQINNRTQIEAPANLQPKKSAIIEQKKEEKRYDLGRILQKYANRSKIEQNLLDPESNAHSNNQKKQSALLSSPQRCKKYAQFPKYVSPKREIKSRPDDNM